MNNNVNQWEVLWAPVLWTSILFMLQRDDQSPRTPQTEKPEESHKIHPKSPQPATIPPEEEEDLEGDKTLTSHQGNVSRDILRSNSPEYSDDKEGSDSTTVVFSPQRSPSSLTEGSVDLEKDPVMTSTMVRISVAKLLHLFVNWGREQFWDILSLLSL